MLGKSDPEDFTNVEERFKLSLINMEKRFVELEMAISELGEKVNAGRIDSVKDLNQRVSDIEDLIMVEQAGILELKSMLERADSKFSNIGQFNEKLEERVSGMVSESESRVKNVEDGLRTVEEALKNPSDLTEEAKERISLLEKDVAHLKTLPQPEVINPLEMGELKARTQNLGKKLAQLESSVGGMQASIDIKIRNLVEEGLKGSTGKGVDFEFVKAKLDSLKTAADILAEKMSAVDLKIGEMDGKVGGLETKVRENPRKMFEELNAAKRDVETAKIRMESVERVVRELTNNVNEIENRAKKFESLESLTNLKKEVDERLRSFKNTENEIGKLSNRVEVMYDDLDKRMSNIKGYDKDIKRLSESTKEFVKDLERIKFDIKNKADRQDVEGLKKTRQSSDELPEGFKVMATEIGARMSDIEKAISILQSSMKDMGQNAVNPYEGNMKELMNKLIFLESRLSAMESMMNRPRPIILE